MIYVVGVCNGTNEPKRSEPYIVREMVREVEIPKEQLGNAINYAAVQFSCDPASVVLCVPKTSFLSLLELMNLKAKRIDR